MLPQLIKKNASRNSINQQTDFTSREQSFRQQNQSQQQLVKNAQSEKNLQAIENILAIQLKQSQSNSNNTLTHDSGFKSGLKTKSNMSQSVLKGVHKKLDLNQIQKKKQMKMNQEYANIMKENKRSASQLQKQNMKTLITEMDYQGLMQKNIVNKEQTKIIYNDENLKNQYNRNFLTEQKSKLEEQIKEKELQSTIEKTSKSLNENDNYSSKIVNINQNSEKVVRLSNKLKKMNVLIQDLMIKPKHILIDETYDELTGFDSLKRKILNRQRSTEPQNQAMEDIEQKQEMPKILLHQNPNFQYQNTISTNPYESFDFQDQKKISLNVLEKRSASVLNKIQNQIKTLDTDQKQDKQNNLNEKNRKIQFIQPSEKQIQLINKLKNEDLKFYEQMKNSQNELYDLYGISSIDKSQIKKVVSHRVKSTEQKSNQQIQKTFPFNKIQIRSQQQLDEMNEKQELERNIKGISETKYPESFNYGHGEMKLTENVQLMNAKLYKINLLLNDYLNN